MHEQPRLTRIGNLLLLIDLFLEPLYLYINYYFIFNIVFENIKNIDLFSLNIQY